MIFVVVVCEDCMFCPVFYVVLGVLSTVLPAKSDSDVIFCLQVLSKTLACMPHLS